MISLQTGQKPHCVHLFSLLLHLIHSKKMDLLEISVSLRSRSLRFDVRRDLANGPCIDDPRTPTPRCSPLKIEEKTAPKRWKRSKLPTLAVVAEHAARLESERLE